MLTIKSATRVQAPPGGHSSITFGSETPLSPSKAAAITEEPVTEQKPEEPASDVATVAETETSPAGGPGEMPSLDTLKIQAIAAIAGAHDAPEVRSALAALLKELQAAAVSATGKVDTEPAEAAADAGANGAATDPNAAAVAALKAVLKLRGTHGIISIGKKFRSMDDSGDHKLSYVEFRKALQEMKLGLAEADMTRLFRHFDSDASGFVSFDELLLALRGQLSERRLEMVRRCFKVLDKTGDGRVTLADLERRYDASRHPDVVAGTKTQRAVLLEFLGVFEGAGGGTAGDGQVDFDEFKNYYAMVSANVDEGPAGDDYFELMMRNVWHVSGGEGWAANTTCKRVLVVLEDDTQKVVELTDDFDVDVKDLAAVKAKLAEQGLTNIKSVALYGDMASAESGGGGTPAPPSPGPAASPGSASRARRNPDHNRSSIIFG